MKAIPRVLLSFCSLLLAVAIFSAICNRTGRLGPFLFISGVAILFALPVWLINLPILFLLKNMGQRQRWVVPALGAVIGPVCLILWCGILVLRGADWSNLWKGDEAGGLEGALVSAFLVGLSTNTFYVLALRIWNRRTDSTHPTASAN